MNENFLAPPASDRREWSIQPQHGGAVALPGALGATEGLNLSVSEIWRILLKWRWLIIGLAAAGLAVAIATTLLTTPIYRGTVVLEINREQAQIIEVGNVQPVKVNDSDYMTTQYGLMRSRSLAERVARQMNLASNPLFVDKDAPRAVREKQAVGALTGNMHVDPVKNSRLVSISFESADPALAANVANGFADNFIASNLERRYETTAYARDFLQKRIATVKQRLEDSERQIVAYAKREGIISLGGGGEGKEGSGDSSGGSLTASTLVALNSALSNAQTDRIMAEQRYRQAQNNRTTTEMLQNPTAIGLRTKLADLQAQYDENLNVYRPDFPSMQRLKIRIDAAKADLARESGTVSGALRSDYEAALARERDLQARVNGLKTSVLDLRGRSIQYNILQREVDTNRTLYDGLLQRFKEVGIAGGIGENLVAIVDRAETPGAPFKPRLLVNLAMGLIAGLLLGLGAAFAIEFIDDTIATPDDVRDKLKLTPLGTIPKAGKSENFVALLGDPRSTVAEAYSSVRTSLQFATEHGLPRTLLVTSSRAAEGKSSTSLALAQGFARLGKAVLLVDADLRKPTFRVNASDSIGLSTLLTGGPVSQTGTIHPTGAENLFVMPGGPIPPNPAELLSGPRMAEILAELVQLFDLVIVDGPPVLGLADAPLLSAVVDGTIVICEAGAVRRAVVVGTVNRLRAANTRLIGAVLTKYSERLGSYGYGYGSEAYSYGSGDRKMIELSS